MIAGNEIFKDANDKEPQNICVADTMVIDILYLARPQFADLAASRGMQCKAQIVVAQGIFAANGETFESLQPHVRMLELNGVSIPVLDIEGLLKTKTDVREKDRIDKAALCRLGNRAEEKN